jgi:hypothetical protein
MNLPNPKLKLPSLLQTLYSRRSAVFLQRLVLFEPTSDNDEPIRHYDYDCEGLEILAGFFKKKHQNILMKAFNQVKAPSFLMARPSATDRRQWKGTTRRTNLNSTFTASDGSPIKNAGLSTIRSRVNDENILQSAARETSKLHLLLSRVKALNISHPFHTDRIRTENGPNRDNATYCLGNSHSRYISNNGNLSCREGGDYQYQSSQRQSRRQFILQKFSRIEDNLQELQGEPEEVGESIRAEIGYLR